MTQDSPDAEEGTGPRGMFDGLEVVRLRIGMMREMRRYPAQFGTDYAPSCCVKRSYAGLLSWSIVTGSGRTALVRNGKATQRASQTQQMAFCALCDPCIPYGVIRFQHRRKINCGSPSQALAPYFFRFLWCRRIGMMPTDHLFPRGARQQCATANQ